MGNDVWIVDDDQGILEVTELVLQEAGFTVKKISSETELKSQLKNQRPDVILLDITIGGVDGREVAKYLKSDPKTEQIPVILMSADVSIEEKAKQAHADAFLKKPYDIIQLEKLVRKYMNRQD